ncbi:MAG: hypothetical protein QM611_09665, partial [Microbacterium sp.]|uniref:hypothetical protein n=1 Tax=Microbacterium sp. TaxID=51671 RepID=UPI0039E59BE9
RVARARAAASARLRSSRAAAWLLDLLVALRPVWWVARGWALYAIPASMLDDGDSSPWRPNSLGSWLMLAAIVLLSVQWGRGRWAPAAWLRGLRITASVVAVALLPILIGAAVNAMGNAGEAVDYDESYSTPGLVLDGKDVKNIFAYDAAGEPIDRVQLFDQDGRPLTTVGANRDDGVVWDDRCGDDGDAPVALTSPGRAPVWNVFPLRVVPDGCFEDEPSVADAIAPTFPFRLVPSAEDVDAAATPREGEDPVVERGPQSRDETP